MPPPSLRFIPYLLAIFLGCLPLFAHAQPPFQVQSVEEAGALAHRVYEDVQGNAWRARHQGTLDARKAARRPLEALELDAAPGLQLTDNAELEHEFEANLLFNLGPGARRARQSWLAAGDALLQQRDAERWLYVTEAERLFAQWWAQQSIAEHLKEDLQEVRAELDHWRQDLREYLSELDRMDADAEAIRLAMELHASILQAQAAEVAFREHIGAEVTLRLAPTEDDDLSWGQRPAHNPWEALLQLVDHLPQLRALEAQAQAAEAQSKVHGSRDIELGVGARARVTDNEEWLLSPRFNLRIPLAATGREEAAISRAEASAFRAEAQWKARALRAWLQGEAERHTALIQATEALDHHAIQQLKQRVDALQRALRAGHVDLLRVFWARRDLHEAIHQAILLNAELDASTAAASGIRTLMEGALP